MASLLSLRNILIPGAEGQKPRLEIGALELTMGEPVAILGPNGSGKSTLLKLLMRELWPLILPGRPKPVVAIDGKAHQSLWDVRSILGVLSPAMAETLYESDAATAEETVIASFFGAYQLYPHHEVTEAMRGKATAALERAAAGHLAGRWRHTLSTGELRRVMIARMLVHEPKALLLDEPTTGLDMGAAHQLMRMLDRLADEGMTLLLVTHHLEEILPRIKRVILLDEGRVVADGEKRELLTGERLGPLFRLDCHIHWREDGRCEARVG